MARITITLLPEERRALQLLSENERRNPRDQAAIMVRERLQQLGLVSDAPEIDAIPEAGAATK